MPFVNHQHLYSQCRENFTQKWPPALRAQSQEAADKGERGSQLWAMADKWLLNLLRCEDDPNTCSGPQRAVQNMLEPLTKLFSYYCC